MPEELYQDVPARRVPFPQSVSESARRMLAAVAAMPRTEAPAIDDKEGWRTLSREGDGFARTMLKDRFDAAAERVESRSITLGGRPCFLIRPKTGDAAKRIVFDIHGGGFTTGGGDLCEGYGMWTAADLAATVYAIDYRMPPDHPYPTPLDDCFEAYKALVKAHDPGDIIVRGVSAGGNLAAALMLRARDEGLPFPAALILVAPETDLTESGDSFGTNADFDVLSKGSYMPSISLYADGHDTTHPYLSPIFGDFALGFPPTLQTVGTRDLFLSNIARLHVALRRAGNYSEIILQEAAPHGGFFGAPEDKALIADIAEFADRVWSGNVPKAGSAIE